MKKELKELKVCAKISEKLTETLKKHDCKIGYVKESAFPEGGYEQIYKYINSCDCSLVFTDSLTFAGDEGTWRANELTHSILTAALPVFLYTGLDDYYGKSELFKGVKDLPNVYPLPDNIKSAAEFIAETMSKL